MLADLGNPSTKTISNHLNVSSQTVKRWIANDSAPKSALLSLFWLTRWGQSAINTQHENSARINASLARAVTEENQVLRSKLAKLHQIADFGAANDASSHFPTKPKDRLSKARITFVPAEEKLFAGRTAQRNSAFASLP